MSAERITLDSNILIYAIDADAGERHTRAIDVVDRSVERDCLLTLQALSEFYFVATRKGKMPQEDAAAQIEDWQDLFPIATPRASTLNRAIAAVHNHNLPFWDAMLWAVAKISRTTGHSRAFSFITLLSKSNLLKRTLENWEQGRRHPTGPAKALRALHG